jgi:hypothetical protein
MRPARSAIDESSARNSGSHDRFAPDAQHLGHDVVGVAHRLQRLRQDHAVERRVVEPASPDSRSLCSTLMPLRTLASTPASSISMP